MNKKVKVESKPLECGVTCIERVRAWLMKELKSDREKGIMIPQVRDLIPYGLKMTDQLQRSGSHPNSRQNGHVNSIGSPPCANSTTKFLTQHER
jgi:hypothetical protein